MSILEVMFAILVTTIGLLGAIAVFPVASAQARRGRLLDSVAVAGISAVHQADVQYMRNPNTWLYYDTASSNYKSVSLTSGEAYFIDPGFMAAATNTATKYVFPYYDLSAATAIESSSDKRMNRITLQAYPLSGSTTAMTGFQAETIFAIGDDLAYTRPEDRSLNAVQKMIEDSSSNKLRRETEGTLTWAATLAPKVDYVSGSVVETDLYVLSILVFDRRNVAIGVDTATTLDDGSNAVNPERLVDVKHFEDAGIGGGEVVLKARSGRNAGDLDLRPNDWIMLSGYKSVTTGTITSTVGPLFLWYRVADTDVEVDSTVSPPERYVTLQGPDWPLYNNSGTTSYTQATIMSGLVAVYEKTVRLDTSN